ncbi:potassium channel family protein [Neosynechococcus sphagnicola]|uniref:potassium channel family protein n=1 Tax=Neosynechococcus sphagnicola TaxID=1501145 RepID=UPI000AD35607|nr:NAD(P)-binding protein [Neosynechococcus sphagnicola]
MRSDSVLPSQSESASPPRSQRFLVCGLGSLGQHCAAALREFGVLVIAIDRQQPQDWGIPDLLEQLDEFILGDCRLPRVLEQARIQDCQAVLMVTSNEQINIEAALTARRLHPRIRLVVRSAKQNLNELLQQSLGNFVAFEPAQLSTSAFALAALGKQTQARFLPRGSTLAGGAPPVASQR